MKTDVKLKEVDLVTQIQPTPRNSEPEASSKQMFFMTAEVCHQFAILYYQSRVISLTPKADILGGKKTNNLQPESCFVDKKSMLEEQMIWRTLRLGAFAQETENVV